MKFDSIDKRLLQILQKDAEKQTQELAEAVNLSPAPCWRRVQRLKSQGVIERQVALVNRESVNVGVTVFVTLRSNQHTLQWIEKFRASVERIPEVMEAYRMSGEIDYMLRIVVPDISAYDSVYKRLISSIPLMDVTSSFAMEELKYTTELPLNYV